jgi:CBS domain containing-hemolysin-like protein
MSDEVTATAALLADNSTYHNHKEQMAYLGAIAYIGAAAVFTFSCQSLLPLRHSAIALLAFTAAAGLWYVWWQLQQRDTAAQTAMRYYNILVKALPEDERSRVLLARAPKTRIPKMLMILTMLFWAMCALYPALWSGCV